MISVKNLSRVGQTSIRAIRQMATKSPTAAQIEAERAKTMPTDLHPNFYRLKETQKMFQEPNGVPVHLKGGVKDKILLYTTVVLIAIGLGGCAEFIYHLP